MSRNNIERLDFSAVTDGPVKFYDPTKNSPLVLEVAANIEKSQYPELSGLSIEHSKRVVGYLQLFTQNHTLNGRPVNIPEEVYDAALLHDFYDTARNDDASGDLVRQHLVKLADSWDEPRSLRILALLRDMSTIEESIRKHVKSAVCDDAVGAGTYDWSDEAPLPDWDILSGVDNHVHIEAWYIKGAEILDRVKNLSGDKTNDLRCISEAESCYIPILNSVGLGALSMEIASSCHIARFRAQGRQDIIHEAVELYRSVENTDPALVCQQVLGLKNVPNIRWTVNESDPDINTGVNCRAGEMLFKSEDGQPIRIEFRQKSIGSLANKIKSKKGKEYTIRDLLGLKVVVGDDDINSEPEQQRLLAELYNSMANGLIANENIKLVRANPSRKPFYVQGKPDFVKKLEEFNIGGNAIRFSQIDVNPIPKPGAYDVAKVTAEVHGMEGNRDDVPVEVQFVTGVSFYWDDVMGLNAHDLRRFSKSQSDNDLSRVIRVVHLRNGVVERRDYLGDPRGRRSSISLAREALRNLLQGSFAKNPELQ